MNPTIRRIIINIIFGLQVLLIFLFFFEDRIALPAWLQVVGRLHPLVLHLPIGFFILILIMMLFRRYLGAEPSEKILDLGLLFTAFAASITALFGFFLSLQDDYGSDALQWHKVSGIALSLLCFAVASWASPYRHKYIFYGSIAITLTTLVIAGHTGAALTHGQNFVLAPVTDLPVMTVENASVYEFAVRPILERKCFSCHNETKAKGGLVMTTIEKFQAGGENGKPWVEGKPEDSRMVKSFYLPLDHDEHMPPDGKPQLTKMEVATIESWIKSGADFRKRLDQFDDNDSLKFIVASFTSEKADAAINYKSYNFEAASDKTIEKLNTPFRSVFPLYEGSPALQADFFLKQSFQLQFLEELKSVSTQLVILNLSKMPVRNKDLELIAAFPNVEILNLNFTEIDGERLTTLLSLKNLESLSLAGTTVTPQHLIPLFDLPNLKSMYVWNTGISEKDIDTFREKYPSVTIIGNLFSDETILKLGKPRLENEAVLRKGEQVTLKHSMPGAKIVFTTNASEPDSTATNFYQGQFTLKETAVLKARACKDGWYCSDMLETTCFVEGITPKDVVLLTGADKQYLGKGASTLTDLQKGFVDILKEPSWLGYRETPFSAAFEFTGGTVVQKIVISYARNIGGFVFPPQEVEIWGGDDQNSLSLIKRMVPEQPYDYAPNGVWALSIPLDSASSYRYYKIAAKPVSRLPDWHNSKGERGWFFVDEVFFY